MATPAIPDLITGRPAPELPAPPGLTSLPPGLTSSPPPANPEPADQAPSAYFSLAVAIERAHAAQYLGDDCPPYVAPLWDFAVLLAPVEDDEADQLRQEERQDRAERAMKGDEP